MRLEPRRQPGAQLLARFGGLIEGLLGAAHPIAGTAKRWLICRARAQSGKMTLMALSSKIRLRPASEEDLDFAWRLYRTLMKPLTEELLEWHEQRQHAMVKQALHVAGTSVVTIEGTRAGWLQVRETADEIYLAQLYIRPESQDQGVGTALVRQLCNLARRQGKALRLDIMTNNRARTLYERLGFRETGKSKHKIRMQWVDNP